MKRLPILGSGSLVLSLAFGAGLDQPVQAATLTPDQRVDLAVDWFTGLFSNQNQVADDPDIPFLTMENCSALPSGGGQADAEYVHLEQYIGGSQLLRTAAYEFSPSDLGVNLSVFPYLDDDSALGTCTDATPTVSFNNFEPDSCDIALFYEPQQFAGSNAPTGCPTSFPLPGSTVISTVTIAANQTDSFDEFVTPFGTSFGTPIEFQRVPERSPVAVMLGAALIGLTRLRRSSDKES